MTIIFIKEYLSFALSSKLFGTKFEVKRTVLSGYKIDDEVYYQTNIHFSRGLNISKC